MEVLDMTQPNEGRAIALSNNMFGSFMLTSVMMGAQPEEVIHAAFAVAEMLIAHHRDILQTLDEDKIAETREKIAKVFADRRQNLIETGELDRIREELRKQEEEAAKAQEQVQEQAVKQPSSS